LAAQKMCKEGNMIEGFIILGAFTSNNT